MASSYTFAIVYPADRADKPTFDVANFQGTEALSTLYRFAINLRSETENITDVLGLRAVFEITVDDKKSTYHGILTEFQQIRKVGPQEYYQAVLSPKLYNLSLYRKSDVFINISLPNILDSVLKDAGFATGVDYTTALSNTGNYQPSTNGYNRWSYVCQYEETCLDFLSRLMEREGIYYYFKQNDGAGNPPNQEQMVITDTKLSHAPATRTLMYRPVSGLLTTPSSDDIQDLVVQQKTLPGMTKLMNYNYETASLGIISAEAYVSNDGKWNPNWGDQSKGALPPPGVVTIYGENFANDTEGENLAVIRAQELFCQGKVFFGDSTVPDLMPGYIIELVHPNEVFNGDYLVRDVSHEGSQQLAQSSGLGSESVADEQQFSYQNYFYFILDGVDGVQFRPPRVTVKPKIHGAMNAIIDGETTGTPALAEMDATGRYKVKLPFLATPKNGGKGSVSIRMATPYAGSGTSYGMHFPLHIGAEVVLSFRDGDPDLPVISGAVYNSLNLDVVNSGNPVQHIIQTPGGNKILMDDTKDGESIYIYSPYDKGSWIRFGKNEGQSQSKFEFRASGDRHEITCGQEDDLVAGSLNIGVLGSRFEMDLGMASDIHMGTMFAVDLGETIDLNAGWNLELGEKHDTLKKEQSITAHDSVQIAAGSDDAFWAGVTAGKTAGFIGLAAASLLLSVAGGDVSGAIFPNEDKPGQQFGVSMALIAVAMAFHVGAYNLLRKITVDLANPKSSIDLDATGIKIKVQPVAANGITMGLCAANAWTSYIDVLPATLATNYDRIGLTNSKTAGGTASMTLMDGDTILILLRDQANVNQRKIELNPNSIVIQDGSATGGKITVAPGSVVVERSTGVGTTSAKITVDGDNITLSQGLQGTENKIMLSANSIQLKFGAGVAVTLSAGTATVGAQVIKWA